METLCFKECHLKLGPRTDPKAEMRPYEQYEVDDNRADAVHPLKRVAYVFRNFERAEYRAEMLARLEKLANSSHLPFVCLPLELARTSDGGLCVICRRYGQPLEALVSTEGLHPLDRAWRIFGNILEGLAALHEQHLCHGDLRLATIYVDEDDLPWITGTAWGPFAHWTHGEFVANETTANYPPEFDGKSQAPTPAADVFALGRLGLCLMTGSFPAAHVETQQLLRGLSRSRRELLRRMLEPDKARRLTADRAFQLFRNAGSVPGQIWKGFAGKARDWKRILTWWRSVAALSIVLLVIFVFVVLHLNGVADLEKKIGDLQNERKDAEDQVVEKHHELEKQKKHYQSQLAMMEEIRAKQKRDYESLLAKKDKKINELLQDKTGDVFRTELNQTIQDLQQSNKDLKNARKTIGELGATLQDSQARLFWIEYAYWPGLSFHGVGDRVMKMRPGIAKEKLQAWMDSFEKAPAYKEDGEEKTDKWWIRLEKGAQTRAGYEKWGKRWRVEMKVGSANYTWTNHDWDEETSHIYSEDEQWGVAWRPDQPIRVVLKQVGRLSNPALVEKLFDGPVAMWQLHNSGWIYHAPEGNDGDWVGIKLSVRKCPGP